MNKCSAVLLGFLLLVFGLYNSVYAQGGFSFPEDITKDKLRFQLVNNLVVLPVTVNGTELSFLLDTGVSSTLLFGLAENDSLELKNANPVQLMGLGEGGTINALKSEGNIMTVGKAVDSLHTLYVVFDQQLNFSTRMGIPVHGIIGYEFFKKFVVETRYTSKKILFSTSERYRYRTCRRCETLPLKFESNKPYVDATILLHSGEEETTLLVDSGSSDALWLFEDGGHLKEFPKNYFNDFLGMGLSGDIFGKRSRVHSITLGSFTLQGTGVAFPDTAAMANIPYTLDRDGSLGGELLRRFTVVMDYSRKTMRLKPNKHFDSPFYYNMSGLVLEHQGVAVAKDVAAVNRQSISDVLNRSDTQNSALSVTDVQVNPVFTFILVPKYVVAELREGSPAALAGIEKGDEVISINGKPAHGYKLYELVALFSSKPGKEITMEVYRNGVLSKRSFILRKLL
jgi:hypothetical protein